MAVELKGDGDVVYTTLVDRVVVEYSAELEGTSEVGKTVGDAVGYSVPALGAAVGVTTVAGDEDPSDPPELVVVSVPVTGVVVVEGYSVVTAVVDGAFEVSPVVSGVFEVSLVVDGAFEVSPVVDGAFEVSAVACDEDP